MKKKRILLCAVNSKYIHSSPAVRYLKTAADILLPGNGYETSVFESSINDTTEHIIYNIMSRRPDIIGFSCYIWNISAVEKLCKSIKSVDERIKIVLGGPEVSYGVSHTNLRECDYDLIVSGEGEKAFPAAVLFLSGEEIPKELRTEKNGRVFTADYIKNLDEIPFIYNEENIKDFSDRIIYYESSRGCPFSCSYCLSSVCGKMRCLSLERVKSDIDFFIEHDVSQVKFVDRTFNCSPERAYKIWEYILKRSVDSRTNFHFEIGADLITEKQIDLLKKMPGGKVQLEIGIQSTNEKSLRESCRFAPNELIFRNVKALREAGNINLHTDLIAGLPYENLERFMESFNQVYELNAHQLQLGFLKRLNGAPLNNLVEKHGYVFTSYPPYEILKNKYISYDEIQILKEVEDVLDKYFNSGRFVLSLKELEKYFKNPFEMYEKIAVFFKEKNLTFASVSSKKLYDFLNEFSRRNGAEISEILLEDFYLSENSEIPPESLKPLVPLNKHAHPAAVRLLKDEGLSKEKKIFAKFINNKALIIDYGNKNPVNGRYRLLFGRTVSFGEGNLPFVSEKMLGRQKRTHRLLPYGQHLQSCARRASLLGGTVHKR